MKVAIEEAKHSLKEGNKGFGAVLVKDEKILSKAHDTPAIDADPTAHAEINTIRKVPKKYRQDLTGCTLISTHEPCPMCTGAIIWANISEIAYGVSIRESKKLGRTMIDLSCKDIIKRSPWKIKIKEGILKKECLRLYEGEIKKWVKELKNKKAPEWKDIEKKLQKKRLEWFEENKIEILNKLKGTDTEKAYQLILMKIGIKKAEAPIVQKTEKRIVFHSKNFCPSLEACKILDLDSREICKKIFERPVQELIKRINSKLKFSRNYQRIRPYENYCEEIITMEK